jgi:hypothetical protein
MSRTSDKAENVTFNSSKSAVILLLVAAAAFVIASKGSAEQGPGDVNVQGGWAYTESSKGGALEHVAMTRAAEDAVWLMLACRADGRLTVSLVHSEQFPFPLKPLFLVKLQSNNVPTALFEAKTVEHNQIFVAPLLMRHIMPLLMQENELTPTSHGAVTIDQPFEAQAGHIRPRPQSNAPVPVDPRAVNIKSESRSEKTKKRPIEPVIDNVAAVHWKFKTCEVWHDRFIGHGGIIE